MQYLSKIACVALFTGSIALAAMPASAQSGAEFYNGKTVNYVVSTEPGGNYDTYGRLVAEFMQKHLPGTTFVVRNMPGAGHMIGANFIYTSAPDGLTIGTFNTGLIYTQLAGDAAAKFDLNKMSWIGKAASDPRVIVMSKQSGITTFDQLTALKEPIKFAASGVGSASYVESTLLINELNLPVRIISGYNGQEDFMALRRGEVEGIVASRSAYDGFIKEGYGQFIAQIGGKDTDVPQLSSMVHDPDILRTLALIESQGTVSRLTAGPPNIPADRLAALRDAYAKATSDPELIQKAKALGLPLEPLTGDEVGEAVSKALDQDPEDIAALKTMLKKEKKNK